MGRESSVLISSVTTRSGVLVVSKRDELGSDETLLGDQLHFAGMTKQLRGQQHRDVFDVLASVAGCVLAIEVGVDRHLRDGASTNGIDEVDGCGATLRSDDVQC